MNDAITLGTFLDPVALALVGGGTLLATCLRAPARDLARALQALPTLARPRFTAEPLLEQVAAQARIARRHGALALDRRVNADADIAAAIALIVDGAGADTVETFLAERRQARAERHLLAVDVWCGMAEAAPAMGMVGTLVGLVAMFVSMNDPAAIGGAMAVALLATLYGALLANLVALPIAHRLRAAARTESRERARLAAPLAALARQEAPRAQPVSFVPERRVGA